MARIARPRWPEVAVYHYLLKGAEACSGRVSIRSHVEDFCKDRAIRAITKSVLQLRRIALVSRTNPMPASALWIRDQWHSYFISCCALNNLNGRICKNIKDV